ncbi:MAG TPA: helix-turn-helix domain-containing protein [Trichocoleus sp.]
MNFDTLAKQVAALSERLSWLIPDSSTANGFQPDTTAAVFKELGFAAEELNVALEEIQQQNESLTEAVTQIGLERKRYESLFKFAPQAYLTTDLEGIIQEVNLMASQLLEVPVQYLGGKPLAVYIHPDDRTVYRAELTRRRDRDYFQEWELRLVPRSQSNVSVACSTVAVRNNSGEAIGFRWALRDISDRKRLEALAQLTSPLDGNNEALLGNRAIQSFSKDEIIPLQHQGVGYLTEGLVKLTTLTDQNKEVLLGIIGPGMPFGAFFTSLPLYQATALSDVHMVSIGLSEILDSACLAQLMFVKTSQRLQQTERMLAIAGTPSAEERLSQLLNFLASEVGKPVEQGIRINLRLTHEDLASACCSTRVTTTRLLGKLQREGKIAFDEQAHIILIQPQG